MEVLGFYLRQASSDVVQTELCEGDEIHFYNGELFVVRRVGSKWNALSIQVVNGDKQSRTVDTLTVGSDHQVNHKISLILKTTDRIGEHLGWPDFEQKKDSQVIVRIGKAPIVATALAPGYEFHLGSGQVSLVRYIADQWEKVPLIKKDGEGHRVIDGIAVSSPDEAYEIVKRVLSDTIYSVVEKEEFSILRSYDSTIPLYVVVDIPPKDFFEQKPAK